MANKYIIHGATFYGDGTSSDEATVDGGVGAWNNINILTGTAPTYGTLSAGDTIYIRSKTSAGADITVTNATVSLGYDGGSYMTWTTWILDDGTVWPGVNGTLTFSATNLTVTFKDYNRYISRMQDRWICEDTATSASSSTGVLLNRSVLHNLLFDYSAATSGSGRQINCSAICTLHNVHVKSSMRYLSLFSAGGYARFTLINPDIELLNYNEDTPVFRAGISGAMTRVLGGKIYGIGTTNPSVSVIDVGGSGYFESIGLQFPSYMKFGSGMSGNYAQRAFALGADGKAGAYLYTQTGDIDSRGNSNYPTLNAVLPDSVSTPWSWYLKPSAYVSLYEPMITETVKMFVDTASVKTVTAEVLVSTTFTSLATKHDLVLNVQYIDDATGDLKSVSSDADGDLDSSTAPWSATTYGSISFNKKKVSVTTPTSIRKDTTIFAFLMVNKRSFLSIDTIVVDPDFQLS